MRSTRINFLMLFTFVLISLCMATYSVTPVWSDDAKALLTQTNKALRQAQKDMFGGKTDRAIASLENIRGMFDKIHTLDPNNTRIKGMEKKYEKLVKDLERRTGKKLGGGTKTASGASSKPAIPDKPPVKAAAPKPAAAPSSTTTDGDTDALVKDASKLLRNAEKSLFSGKTDQTGQELSRAKELIDKIKAADPKNSRLSSLENKYGQVEKKLTAKTRKKNTESITRG